MNKLKNIQDSLYVVKDNILNSAPFTDLTLVAYRIYLVYLSLIDCRNVLTRKIAFDIQDFFCFFGYTSYKAHDLREHLSLLEKMTVSLQQWTEENKSTELTEIPVFSEVAMMTTLDGRKIVEMNCSDSICPYIFNLNKNFVSYKLSDVKDIDNIHYLRFFEIVKQHSFFRNFDNSKALTIDIDDLRKMLGLKDTQYSSYKDFRVYVLNKSMQFVKKRLEVWVSYSEKKRSKKVVSIVLTFKRIKQAKTVSSTSSPSPKVSAKKREEIHPCFGEPMFDRFTLNQLVEMRDLAYNHIPEDFVEKVCEQHSPNLSTADIKEWAVYVYIVEKINDLNNKNGVTHYYCYLRKAIKNNW